MSLEKQKYLPWFVEKTENVFRVGGDIHLSCVDDFCETLGSIGTGKKLNMFELEIDDGSCMAVVISTLREIAPCILIEAPKMLAHTLYKVNNQKIDLLDPRSY